MAGAGSLDFDASGGDLIDSTGQLSVTGNASFTVTTTDLLTLDNTSNDFSSVNVSAGSGAAVIADADDIDIGTSSAGGSLTVTSAGTGDITNSGTITAATLIVSNLDGSIDLDNSANAVTNLGPVTSVDGVITFDNGDNDLTLVGTVQTQNDAGGAITIDVGTGSLDTDSQDVLSRDSLDANNDTGTITIIADSLDLGTVADTIVTEGAVALRPTTSTRDILVSTAAGGGNESADGGDTQFNLTTDEVAAIDGTTASSVTIGDGTFTGQVTLNADTFDFANLTIAGGNIDIDGALNTTNNTALTLDGVGIDVAATVNMGSGSILFDAGGDAVTSAGNSLTITTTDTAAGGLTINNATTIGANSATDDAALETAVAQLTITSSDGVAFISEADAVQLQGISVGTNTFGVNIEAAGDLTQTATGISATSLEVTNTVGATTLTASGNSFSNLGSSDFTGQTAALETSGALDIDGVSGASSLTLTQPVLAISQTAALSRRAP